MKLGTIILSAALSYFCLGIASCKSKPDIWECGHVWPPGNEIQDTYMKCHNYRTEKTRNIPIRNMNRCIRETDKACRWLATDIYERERISSCAKNPQQDMCK